MKAVKLLAIVALTPGWIIPRILGTAAFLAAPSVPGLVALIAWWTVVPALWIVTAWYLKRMKQRKLT